MLTNDQLRRLMEEIPERRPRSRLIPYGELIAEMRSRNYSYREISRFLARHCEVAITHNAVRNYVKRCALESHGSSTSPILAVQRAPVAGASTTKPEESPNRREEMEAVRERIAALKTRRLRKG